MDHSSQTHEKRRAPRIRIPDPRKSLFSAYILRKSASEKVDGQLLDYSENGLGVRITSASNLPQTGDSLFGLFYQLEDQKEVSKELGRIQHIESFVDDSGKKQIRLGIEIKSFSESPSQIKTSELPSRPHRYVVNHDCLEDTEILLFLENEKIKGNLLNFSQKGLAIILKRETPLKLLEGEILRESLIKVKNKELFHGDLIIRNIRENPNEIVIGCETQGSLIDIDLIQNSIDTSLLVKDTGRKLERFDEVKHISSAFKVVVTDLRYYLEQVNEIAVNDNSSSFSDEVVRELYPLFKAQMDEIYSRFVPCVKALSPKEHATYKSYFQKHLLSLILSSPFINHAYQKPCGYSGDYQMVLKILDKELEGKTLLARLLNMFIWNMDVTQAHRNRIGYLIEKIAEVTFEKPKARILTIGCGPAREIKEVIDRGIILSGCSFTLIDFDSRALEYSQEEILSIIALKKADIKTEFINKSVRQIIKTKSCDLKCEKYDLIYCAGLFDYLSDPFCEKLLEIMSSHLQPEGILIATNVSEYNYYQYVMEFMGEWYLTHRSPDAMLKMVSKLQKKINIRVGVDLDSTKVNVMLNAKQEKNINAEYQRY